MPLSRVEVEAMHRDELIDAIVGLSQSVEDKDPEIDALRNRYDQRTSGLM